MAEGQAEGLGQPVEEERLRGAVGADQEDRRLGGEGGQDGRLEGVPPGDTEGAEQSRSLPGGLPTWCGSSHGRLLLLEKTPGSAGPPRRTLRCPDLGLTAAGTTSPFPGAPCAAGSGKAPWDVRPGCRGRPPGRPTPDVEFQSTSPAPAAAGPFGILRDSARDRRLDRRGPTAPDSPPRRGRRRERRDSWRAVSFSWRTLRLLRVVVPQLTPGAARADGGRRAPPRDCPRLSQRPEGEKPRSTAFSKAGTASSCRPRLP